MNTYVANKITVVNDFQVLKQALL